MFYSALLTITADANIFELGVRQLAARIICHRKAANFCKSGEPFLH
jgi:hypothetical protein